LQNPPECGIIILADFTVKKQWECKKMQVTERKPKKRAKFRISFVVLFFLASFIICFFSYMKNDNDFKFFNGEFKLQSEDGGESDAENADNSALSIMNSELTDAGVVPESEAKDLSYLNNALFIGGSELSSLSGFAWVKPDRVLSDNAIKSSNIDSLVVRFNGINQTPEEAVLSVKPSALYILLRPEETLDTVHLGAFIDGVSENLKNTEIYLISAFPPREDSAVTTTETDTFNVALLTFAEENGIKYLDINLSLTDNAGRLKKDYVSGSGISGAGTEFFANYILSHT
jgi:hypothetical protein